MRESNILIVDDEKDICALLKGILEDEGYATRTATSAEKAYALAKEKAPDLAILDIWLQGSADDGMAVLEKLKEGNPFLPVVMISGHGTIETAVEAIKKGAYDFIEKPFKADRLLLMIQRALESARLRRENETLKRRISTGDDEVVGVSPVIEGIRQVLKKAAPTNSRVLLTGEAGTGKNLAAQYIHRHSARADAPFMVLNCTTMHPGRLEVELFGASGGAPGEPSKTGLLELADGGTLLLDEVVDLPIETQGKIVRFLQDGTYQRVADNKQSFANVRIIATASDDIEKAIEQGRMRSDLYYRLNVVPIHMPPLRARASDFPVLIETLVEALAREHGFLPRRFSEPVMIAMQTYHWPGNIRQLRNVLEWMMIMHAGGGEEVFTVEHLPPEITGKTGAGSQSDGPGQGAHDFILLTLREAREKFERDYLKVQVERFQGNISQTAQFIGMERSALHRKLKSLDICPGGKDNVAEEQNNKQAGGRRVASG